MHYLNIKLGLNYGIYLVLNLGFHKNLKNIRNVYYSVIISFYME